MSLSENRFISSSISAEADAAAEAVEADEAVEAVEAAAADESVDESVEANILKQQSLMVCEAENKFDETK